MKMFGVSFSAVWMICCCCLVYVSAHDVCQGKFIKRINLTTKLQSEILLPCYFEAAVLETNMTKNVSAEWTQIKEPVEYIAEITVSGSVFWNHRGKRIKTFTDHFSSGNFSILIHNVQQSDLGLYRCQLFRGSNCSLGCIETKLSLAAVEFSLLNNWQLIAAVGGVLLLSLFTACAAAYTCRNRKCSTKRETALDEKNGSLQEHPVDEITYASVVHKSHNCNNSDDLVHDKPINSSTDVSDHLLYAAVKKVAR